MTRTEPTVQPTLELHFGAVTRDEAEDRLLDIAATVQPHFGILALVIGDSAAPFAARVRAAELALAHLPSAHSSPTD